VIKFPSPVPLALLLLSLSLTAGAAAQQRGTDSDWVAPQKESTRRNPIADKPHMAAGGQKVFNRGCAVCHGDEAHRAATKAPDLGDAAVQTQSDGEIFWKITNGNARKGMPSWSSIPEPQRWQLVLYIRSLKANDATRSAENSAAK
jgi:mono/diheme cytochrome c family protein